MAVIFLLALIVTAILSLRRIKNLELDNSRLRVQNRILEEQLEQLRRSSSDADALGSMPVCPPAYPLTNTENPNLDYARLYRKVPNTDLKSMGSVFYDSAADGNLNDSHKNVPRPEDVNIPNKNIFAQEEYKPGHVLGADPLVEKLSSIEEPVFSDKSTAYPAENVASKDIDGEGPEPEIPKKKKIQIINFGVVLPVLGAMFIGLAGIVFAAAAWGQLDSVMRSAVLSFFAVLFFAFGALAEKKLDLDIIGKVFFALGTVYLPSAVLAAAVMRLLGDGFTLDGEGCSLVISTMLVLLCLCSFIGAVRYASRVYASVGFVSFSGALTAFFAYIMPDGPALGLCLAVYSLAVVVCEPFLEKHVKNEAIWSRLVCFPVYNAVVLAAAALFISGTGYVSLAASAVFAVCFLTKRFTEKGGGELGILPFTVLLVSGIIRGFLPEAAMDFAVIGAAVSLIQFIIVLCGVLNETAQELLKKVCSVFSGATIFFGAMLALLPGSAVGASGTVPLVSAATAAVMYIQLLTLRVREKEKGEGYAGLAFCAFAWLSLTAGSAVLGAYGEYYSYYFAGAASLLYWLISFAPAVKKYTYSVYSEYLLPLLAAALALGAYACGAQVRSAVILVSSVIFVYALFLCAAKPKDGGVIMQSLASAAFSAGIAAFATEVFGNIYGWYIAAAVAVVYYIAVYLTPLRCRMYSAVNQGILSISLLIFMCCEAFYSGSSELPMLLFFAAFTLQMLFLGVRTGNSAFKAPAFGGFSAFSAILGYMLFADGYSFLFAAALTFAGYLAAALPDTLRIIRRHDSEGENIPSISAAEIALNVLMTSFMLFDCVCAGNGGINVNASAALFFTALFVQLLVFAVTGRGKIFSAVCFGAFSAAALNLLLFVLNGSDNAYPASAAVSLAYFSAAELVPFLKKRLGGAFSNIPLIAVSVLFTFFCAISVGSPHVYSLMFTAFFIQLLLRCITVKGSKARPFACAFFCAASIFGSTSAFISFDRSNNFDPVYISITLLICAYYAVSHIKGADEYIGSPYCAFISLCGLVFCSISACTDDRNAEALCVMLAAAVLSFISETADRSLSGSTVVSSCSVRIFSPIICALTFFPLYGLTEGIYTAYRLAALIVLAASFLSAALNAMSGMRRYYTVCAAAITALSVIPAFEMNFCIEIPLLMAAFLTISLVRAVRSGSSGRPEMYGVMLMLTAAALYCGGYAYGGAYMLILPCSELILVFFACRILDRSIEDQPLIGCVQRYLWLVMPVICIAMLCCYCGGSGSALLIWGALLAICVWSHCTSLRNNILLYPVLIVFAAALARLLEYGGIDNSAALFFIAAVYAGIGRLLYSEKIISGAFQSDCFMITALILSPSFFFADGDNMRWVCRILAALIALALIRKKSSADKISLCVTAAALFAVRLWQSQPFFVLPELIKLEYYLLPCLVLAAFLGLIWKHREKHAEIAGFAAISVMAAVMLINAVISGEAFDAVFIGALLLAMLAAAFILKRKRWLVCAVVGIVAQAVLLTLRLYGSMAWWVYLLMAGIILIAVSIIGERRKKRHSDVNYVSRWKW